MSALPEWEVYYLIVGGAAGALIGLQFVVLTLLAEKPPPDGMNANAAFSTPTIVHFTSTLVLAAILSVPWDGLALASWACTILGLVGAAYVGTVVQRVRRQRAYRPGLEDWMFHTVIPGVAYLGLAAAGLSIGRSREVALDAIAAAALTLLLVGIHNAWDAVSFHVFARRYRDE